MAAGIEVEVVNLKRKTAVCHLLINLKKEEKNETSRHGCERKMVFSIFQQQKLLFLLLSELKQLISHVRIYSKRCFHLPLNSLFITPPPHMSVKSFLLNCGPSYLFYFAISINLFLM